MNQNLVFKRIDFVVQIVLCSVLFFKFLNVIQQLSDTDLQNFTMVSSKNGLQYSLLYIALTLLGGSSNFYTIYLYFSIGIWQFLSTLVNRFKNKQPLRMLRKVYEFLLILIVVSCLFLLHPTSALIFIVSMVFIGLVMAIFYLIITFLELLNLERKMGFLAKR